MGRRSGGIDVDGSCRPIFLGEMKGAGERGRSCDSPCSCNVTPDNSLVRGVVFQAPGLCGTGYAWRDFRRLAGSMQINNEQ